MNTIKIFFNLLIITALVSCAKVKDYFPDKEKDYQLTSEIPELIVPEDLITQPSQQTIIPKVEENKPIPANNDTPAQTVDEPKIEKPVAEEEGETELYESYVETQPEVIEIIVNKPDFVVRLNTSSTDDAKIDLGELLETSWRIVGKAISRNALEVTERNEQDAIYTVQYEPDFKGVQDGSIWDEVLFIFGEDPTNEQEYKIHLTKNDNFTEIRVRDNNLSTSNLKLLILLYETIKNDLIPAE